MTASDPPAPLPLPAPRRPGGARRALRIGSAELTLAAVLLVVLAVVGVVVGLLWGHLAPRALNTVVDAPQRLFQPNNQESEAQIATDGGFALTGAGLGLITGVLAWRWRTARGPFLMVMLAVASLLGAVIAWRFGLWVGRHPTDAQLLQVFSRNGNTFRQPLELQAKAALFFQPIAAVVAALLSVGFSRDREPEPAPTPPPGSGQPEPSA